MKLLHTSDWHFGMPLGTDSYADDQKFFLDRLYDIIINENIGAVLLAGDVYDSSVVNAEAIKLYGEAVTRICAELKVPMIVIAGNHDSGPRLAACRELLRSAGLFVNGKLERDIRPVTFEDGKVAVYPIPFFNKDEVAALFFEKSGDIRSLETAYKVVCDNIRENMDNEATNIIVSHAYIVNAELSESDRAARVGFAAAVSKDVFEGFDYVALGHIHKPQVIDKHIRYSGSPVKYSFGAEENHEKCVIIIDTDDMSQKEVTLGALHDRKSISGTYEEIVSMTGLEDCYLRINITDRYAGIDLYGDLKSKFPYMLELTGKGFDETGGFSGITAEDLEKLDELGIMKKFMEENYSYTPDERQTELFKLAVCEGFKEGDVG